MLAGTESGRYERESYFGGAATREKVGWYQTVLRVAGGYEGVPIKGNHNNRETRRAPNTMSGRF